MTDLCFFFWIVSHWRLTPIAHLSENNNECAVVLLDVFVPQGIAFVLLEVDGIAFADPL